MQLLREEEPECKDFKNFQADHTTKYKNVCPAENTKDVVADVPFNKEISVVWIINLISHLKIGKKRWDLYPQEHCQLELQEIEKWDEMKKDGWTS